MISEEMKEQLRQSSTSEIRELLNEIMGKMPAIILNANENSKNMLEMFELMIEELKDRNIDTSQFSKS